MTMIEKMARAIYTEFENRPSYAQAQMNNIIAHQLALAALIAMREPSDGQRNVFFAIKRPTTSEADAVMIDADWERAIDAAITEAAAPPPIRFVTETE